MLVHSVYFWLQPNLTEADRTAFFNAIETLREIDAAEAVYIGTPAPVADRPVLEKSYECGLTVIFTDIAAHDSYQAHPLHQAFINSQKSKWSRVQVFDTN